MSEKIKILLVDDHPIIVDAYKNSLSSFKEPNLNSTLEIDVAFCTDTAIHLLNTSEEYSALYDIVFLDIKLPISKDGKIRSGEDLGLLIRERFPETKILIISGHYSPITLGTVLHTVNPEGLLYKGDINITSVSEALKSILKGIPFYSKSILNLLRKKISSNIILGKLDKQLLYELSKGAKTKDLVKILPLSAGGIEKRKRQLKELFGTLKKDDEALVNSAIEKGFI